MTEDKARKRATRTRMAKTGERYTAARRHVVKQPREAPLPPRVGEPGLSEESVRQGTGRGWDAWLRILDDWGASKRRHSEIARYLSDEHGVDGWWAQGVTVGYERARGMRARHQGLDGFFSVSVSRTFPVEPDGVFAAFTEASLRNRWLEPGTLRIRTSQPGRTARFDGPDGSRVIMYVEPKGVGKTTVGVQVERITEADGVERARSFWKERLGRLGDALR